MRAASKVYLTSPGIALSGASPTFNAIPQGTYGLRITGAGKNTHLRFELPSLKRPEQETLSLIIPEAPGGSWSMW